MQVFITGHTGMLGSAVLQEARRRGINSWATNIPDTEYLHLNSKDPEHTFLINCIGAIPQGKRQGSKMVYANAVMPWILAEKCKEAGIKLIHISTDCVFGGYARMPYDSLFNPDAKDLYGSTKIIGEKITSLGATVVRTSFVGLRHGLLRWLIDNKGGEVEGYEKVLWTGSTVWEAASGIFDLIERGDLKLIEHLSTERIWSKSEVLQRLNELLDLNIKIKTVHMPVSNRALVPTMPIRDLNDRFVATRLLEEWQK